MKITLKNPIISIIIPIYNLEKFLEPCLESIVNQSYQNLEIILVNDGSTDQSKKICQIFASKDKRINLINQKNQGLSAARNTGIKQSKGDYIALVDGDDTIDQNFIETLVDTAQNSFDVVVAGYRTIYPDHTDIVSPLLKSLSGTKATIELLTEQQDYQIIAWNKLYKRELFKDITYPKGKIHEDNLTTYKILSKAKKIKFIPDPLYNYYKRSNSITVTSDILTRLKAKEEAAIEAKHFFKNSKTLSQASDIAVLLSHMGYIDHVLSGLVKNSNNLLDSTIKNILSKKKEYQKNPFITKKLKLYLMLLSTPNSLAYKLFRKIIHN